MNHRGKNLGIRSLFTSLAARAFLVCVLTALIASLAGSYALYQGASDSLRQAERERLMSTAATASLQIDPVLHEKIRTPRDESSDAYRKLAKVLRRIRAANPGTRYVYTMRATSDPNTLQFVVDGEENPKDVSHVGEHYDVRQSPEMREAFNGPTADHDFTTDKWGVWLSGNAPIRNTAGKTVAVLGMDVSENQLRYRERYLYWAAVKNAVVALLLAILLSLLVTSALLKPVRAFTRAAEQVRGGDLECRVEVTAPRELGELAESFNGMVRALKENREWLTEQSTRDFLTGLQNHRGFQERLELEVERANRYGQELCLLFIDLDRFKSINDALGHPAGDSILRQMGPLLRDNIRSIDVAARYGGDEFAVILPETDHESGKQAAERIRAQVEAHDFFAASPGNPAHSESVLPSIRVTVTLGLACAPQHHHKRDGLVMAADIALCRAKQIARNSIGSYEDLSDNERRVDPQEIFEMLHKPDLAAVTSLAAAVDAKDRYTSGHSERVARYALALGEALDVEREIRDRLKIAGLLHDLGKIGVPDQVLNKPGSLSRDERDQIEQHPSLGGDIVRRAPQLDALLPAILHHHERWDGKGYPSGLAGEEIPLIARIMGIADAFDAMTSDRPYRKALPVETAILELRTNAGTQFDPALVEAFIRSLSQEQSKAA